MKDKIIVLKIIQEENGDLECNCNINMKSLSIETVNKIEYLTKNYVYEITDLLEVDNYDKIWD